MKKTKEEPTITVVCKGCHATYTGTEYATEQWFSRHIYECPAIHKGGGKP